MRFGFCQIFFTAWLVLGLGMHLAKHGEPRDGNYSFWVALISSIIQLALLYFGGFYG